MAVDLVLTGLPADLLPDGRIDFRGRVLVGEVGFRSWEDLRPVLQDPGSCPAGAAYAVYRDVCRPEHRGILKRVGLRYDLTVVLPGRAGREYARTHGHC
ncbi:MAG: glucose-6-phosphate isomerase family protein, partial [Bacillota bacterium]